MPDVRTRRLTRQQINQFIPSERGVRAFEDVQTDIIDQSNAIATASFLTLSGEPSLGSERVFTPGGGLTGSDGGPNSTYTLSIANSGVTAGTYGSASQTVSLNINAQGRVTAAAQFTLLSDNVTEGTTNLFFTNARARAALSGGTGISYSSATGVIAVANTAVTPGSYGSGTQVATFTVDQQGRLTAAANAAITSAALTKTDDTNVTLTLGGAPTTALLTATSLTLGWTGTLAVSRGGTGAGTLTGYVKGNGISAFTAAATVPASDISGGAALTKTDDTNVTLTLGGTPTTALLTASSLTLGWTGTLAVSRGGTGAGTLSSGYLLKGNGTSAVTASLIYDNGTVLRAGDSTLAGDAFVRLYDSATAGGGVTLSTYDYLNYTALKFYRDNGSPTNTVGTITCTDTTTAYNTSSDYRLKDITGPLSGSAAFIDALKPVEGTWRSNGAPFIGFLAHEVQAVARTRIATGEKDGDEMQAMDYSAAEIIASLVSEVQALRRRVAALEESP